VGAFALALSTGTYEAIAVSEPPTPAEVMLEATMATLRAGRFPPGRVIQRQLDALAAAGYRLEPHLDDGGAALMLGATKRAFRLGSFTPAVVIARQLAAVTDAGYVFVRRSDGGPTACASFQWGPQSFDACARCGLSFWRHTEGADHAKGSHRRS